MAIVLRFSRVALCYCVVFVAFGVNAGELSPPAGAILNTDAVLLNDQWTTLPFFIAQPGVYKLTSDLTGVAGQSGIVITSDNVTIDLNGFTLRGAVGSKSGITVGFGTWSGLRIQNGFIRGWPISGIVLNEISPLIFPSFEFVVNDVVIQDVTVTDSGNGIRLAQRDPTVDVDPFTARVEGCVVDRCGSGIIAMESTLIKDCVVRDSTTGIEASHNSRVVGCIISNCGIGVILEDSSLVDSTVFECITGVALGQGAVVSGSHVHNNFNFGLMLWQPVVSVSDVVVRDCEIIGNANGGIDLFGISNAAIYNNVFRNNPGGAILNVGTNDAPLSATSVGAGPFDNIGN